MFSPSVLRALSLLVVVVSLCVFGCNRNQEDGHASGLSGTGTSVDGNARVLDGTGGTGSGPSGSGGQEPADNPQTDAQDNEPGDKGQ